MISKTAKYLEYKEKLSKIVPKFKVGDRVIVVVQNEWFNLRGRKGTILAIELVGLDNVQYNVDMNHPNFNFRLKEAELELA